MKLAGFRLYRYHLSLSEPLQLKETTLHRREGLLVELTGDGGAAGWGETAPLPGFSREGPEEAAEQLHDLATQVMGSGVTADSLDPEGPLADELDRLALSPSARFGFELALWNLYAASRGKSLPELLTPRSRATVPVNALISGPPERVLEEASTMRAAGYEAVKLRLVGGLSRRTSSLYARCMR